MFGLGIYAYLAAGLAIVALVGGFYIRARASGRNAERARQAERTIHAAETRAKADATVSGSSDDDLDDLLRHPDRR